MSKSKYTSVTTSLQYLSASKQREKEFFKNQNSMVREFTKEEINQYAKERGLEVKQ